MLKFHSDLVRGLGLFALSGLLALGACADDGGGDETSDGSSSGEETTSASTTTDGMTTTETGGPMVCLGSGEGAAADGAACTANGDCMSGVCLLFSDAPPTPDAVCGPTPANCETRVTATVKNLTDGMPVANQAVRVVKALDGITNPTGATALAEGMSGGDGRVDITTTEPVVAPFGIVAVIAGGDFFTTATGISAPVDAANNYNVAGDIHEFWGVPSADLTTWSTALEGDADIEMDRLPLGDNGGVVGFIRDAATGDAIAGATAAPEDEGSGMVIRYLQDDGSFTADGGTGTAGLFVAIGVATTGENFVITAPGGLAGSGTAGSADNVVFTLIVDAQ